MSTLSTSLSNRSSRSSLATTFALLSMLAACGGGGQEGVGGKGPGGSGTGGLGQGGAAVAACEAGCPGGYTCTDDVCTGGDPLGIALSVTTYPVSGTITVDGQTPMDPDCVSGVVDIDLFRRVPRDPAWAASGTWVRGSVPCGATDGAFSFRAPRGKHVALVTTYDTSAVVPGSFAADPAFEVTGPVTGVSWALTTVPLTGTLVADGEPPAAMSTCGSGQVRLKLSTDTGASFSTKVPCAATDGAFDTRVAPGTYRVHAEKLSGTSFPSGSFVVKSDLAVAPPAATAALEVGLVDVSGKLLVDGQPPKANCVGSQGRITLASDQGALFSTSIGCGTPDGAFTVRAAPGTYRVLVEGEHTTSTLPHGVSVVDPALVVDGAKSGLTWDISPATISGTFDVDGVPAQSLANCADVNFTMELRSADGASFLATPDCQGTWSAVVAPGAYRVIGERYPWDGGLFEVFVPETDVVVTGPQTGIALSMTTVAVGGTLQVDGASDCTGAQIFLNGSRGGSFEAELDCASPTGAWSARVTPGLYEVGVGLPGMGVAVVDTIELR